jgi:GNAT superfamily N-acetyltransferase
MSTVGIYGYVPGAIGRVTQLHALYYSRNWGFGLYFEAKVARELAEFLSRFNEKRDGFWTMCSDSSVEGSIAIDAVNAATEGAHLRWFILSHEFQGLGYGTRLLDKALSFCKEKGYMSVYLWTFKGLDAAKHIYVKFGFRLAQQDKGTQWGKEVLEQKLVLQLS